MSAGDPIRAAKRRARRSSEENRRRTRAMRELSDRLQHAVEAQVAGSLEPPAMLATLDREGRLRTWRIPATFPSARLEEMRSATAVLTALVRRFDATAHALVLPLPTLVEIRDPAIRSWARSLGLVRGTVLVHVSEGMVRLTSGARIIEDEGSGAREVIAWHETRPLDGPFAPLDEALVAPVATRAERLTALAS